MMQPCDLREQLLERLEVNHKKREFLSDGNFRTLVTTQTITACLPNASPELVLYACSDARKLFTILILAKWDSSALAATMASFKTVNLTDKNLPMESHGCQHRSWNKANLLVNHQRDQQSANTVCSHHIAWNVTHDWKITDYRKFYKAQSKVLTLVFTAEGFEYNLENEYVQPIMERVSHDTGYFSTVYKAKLHEDHRPGFVKGPYIAIKKIGGISSRSKTSAKEVWKSEVDNLRNLRARSDHPNFIRCIAAVSQDDKFTILFEWADGGNLRQFWKDQPRPSLGPERIREVLQQISAITEAVRDLHRKEFTDVGDTTVSNPYVPSLNATPQLNLPSGATADGDVVNWRHGDLKPDNILRFTNVSTWLGDLKVADLGLTKIHKQVTGRRNVPSTQIFATMAYQPPEAVTKLQQPTSRLFDMWSMGCVIFEFVIWLLYGWDALEEFYKSPTNGIMRTLFYDIQAGKQEIINPTTERWMRSILHKDPECNTHPGTVLGALLRVVKTKLLVREEDRIPSWVLIEELNAITRSSADPKYLFSGTPRERISLYDIVEKNPASRSTEAHLNVPAQSSMLKVAQSGNLEIPAPPGHAPGTGPNLYFSREAPLDENVWNSIHDERFNELIVGAFGTDDKFSRPPPSKLCHRCLKLNFRTDFPLDEELQQLKVRSLECSFCKLLLHHLEKYGERMASKFNVYIRRSGIGLDPHLPELSICRIPNQGLAQMISVADIQLGLPILPKVGSDSFFNLLRLWLKDCDENHTGCHSVSNQNFAASSRRPTRLIDVGLEHGHTSNVVRLIETKNYFKSESEDIKFIALSHAWGKKTEHTHFKTRTDNLEQHKREISIDKLPATFKDAVKVTRVLKVQYLWIDSLCIIQGPGGDWNDEAPRMDAVFSSAYFVLAASRATGTSDGFLSGRQPAERAVATFERENEDSFYVCEAIDDFQGDVIDGPLNKRGWVFQERALACRTIFFTAKQTYWECGEGIRCETLSTLKNNQATILGDPQFPKIVENGARGDRIHHYQSLYEQYSRRDFTNMTDRPIAISGLEQRLIAVLGTNGGFGVLQSFLGRTLLWRRGSNVPCMTPIKFPEHMEVPSWSWMAYEGGITFINVGFDGVEWEEKEIHSPWSSGGPGSPSMWRSAMRDHRQYLTVTARDLHLGRGQIVFDAGQQLENQELKCVIIGKKKSEEGLPTQTYYVLIVAQVSNGIFERVGAGYVPKERIKWNIPSVDGRVR